MKLALKEANTGGHLLLLKDEEDFDRLYHTRDRTNKYFTIAWNYGKQQVIMIDGQPHDFMPDTVLTLLFDHSFYFENASDVIAWQFNREFYCIIDHDAEVSCVGFLFGVVDHLFIRLDADDQRKMKLLLDMFIQEFHTPDNIQHELLLSLLKRLVVFITKMARSEFVPVKKLQDNRFDIIRKFNLLVEGNYRSQHSVSFYAEQLNKSPKTLSNLFALYNNKTPVQVIQERILMEARRLLTYTNQSVKQITFDLGFEDPAHFSNFFKKFTDQSPLDFRKNKTARAVGK